MSRYSKAIVAFLTALAGASATIFADSKTAEMVAGVCLVLATTFGVWAVPNDAPAGERPDPNISERGHSSDVLLVVLAVVLVIVILVLAGPLDINTH